MLLLAKLRDPGLRLSKSARRVAQSVLADPAAATRASIIQLARTAGVSEPTVNRFCTGLGCAGFPDFKLRLAAELAREDLATMPGVRTGDPMGQVVETVFAAARAGLQATQRSQDPAALEQAVSLLFAARSILLCGQGASGPVALDAQHKLLVFGIPVSAHLDAVQQRMCAAGSGSADCVVCISYTGRTIATVEVAAVARAAGARVIGITAPFSPLARVCDIVLPVATTEDTEVYLPMSSRIAQLAVIDVLVAAIALRFGPDLTDRFLSIKHAVRATREPLPSENDGDTIQ